MSNGHNIRWVAQTALLAAFIWVTGSIKLPGIIPGSEFQLSAPIAVAICAVFGFRQYITAGIIASTLGLLLGTQTLPAVLVAMVFRVVVGGVLALPAPRPLKIVLAGPLGTTVARFVLGAVMSTPALPLLGAALPGMLYTALVAWPLTLLMEKARKATGALPAHA